MYAKCFKRVLDFSMAFIALVVLLPILLLLTVTGSIAMHGNPFFVQKRPGKDEKVFNLIKFRSMNNRKDSQGNLLLDEDRLNKYGRFLRSTSLDELPEIFNILTGSLSFIGPRPLVCQYLPFYTDKERLRHSVRPGLTGLAQVSGRNSLKWEAKFAYDISYVENLSFFMDLKIFFKTIKTVLKRENIGQRGSSETLVDFDVYRRQQWEESNVR